MTKCRQLKNLQVSISQTEKLLSISLKTAMIGLELLYPTQNKGGQTNGY